MSAALHTPPFGSEQEPRTSSQPWLAEAAGLTARPVPVAVPRPLPAGRPRRSWRGGLYLVALALVIGWSVACLSYLVHARTQSIFLGYRIGQARTKMINLFEENRQLQIEARIPQTPEKLQQAAAMYGMGLRPPTAAQARFLADVLPAGRTARPGTPDLQPEAPRNDSGLAVVDAIRLPGAPAPVDEARSVQR